MNILIATAGSRGDVQPYIALGKGLHAAGHAVTLCTHARFENFVTSHGLAHARLSDDLLDLMDSAGLRAGRPTVICPFFGDQPFWGWRVHDLGVGSAPIPQKKLTAAKLAAALREVTTSRAIQRRAQSLGETIRREEGIARAVALIEHWYGSRS